MAIQIKTNYLTDEQIVKIFSNPVSGIACDKGIRCVLPVSSFQNIRYSKSMILKALDFWFDQLRAYFMKVWNIRHPIMDVSEHIIPELRKLGEIMCMIKEDLPDTFLFSHRHIQFIRTIKGYSRFTDSIQMNILKKKYLDLFQQCKDYGFQEQTMDPCLIIKTDIGIEFTVFPCEHPYIEKQKISKVGITDNGNVYILHPVGKKK